MEDMVNKDSRDWLELAADKPVEDTPDVNANRPRTTGSINERKKSGQCQTQVFADILNGNCSCTVQTHR